MSKLRGLHNFLISCIFCSRLVCYLEFVRSVPGPLVAHPMHPASPVLSASFSTPTRPMTRSRSQASTALSSEERDALNDGRALPQGQPLQGWDCSIDL